MLKKMKVKVFTMVLALTLISASFVNIGSSRAMAEVKGPELLITEIMPVAVEGEDPFEYIELYNNSDRNIDLKNYKFLYPSIDITASKVIPSKGTIAICTRNTTGLESFNAFYSKSITSDKYMTLGSTKSLLDSTANQYVFLAKDDDTIVSYALYGTGDFELKKSVGYKYPEVGLEMIKYAQKQAPTPGEVNQNQVPSLTVPVTSIVIDASKSMKIGDISTIAAVVYPTNATNKEITWFSYDTRIAEVYPGGLVYAKAEGSTLIRATTKDGGFNRYCTITVSGAGTNVPVQDVKLNKNFENLEMGKVLKLTATIIPDNATNKQLVWASTDANIAVVDMNGIVTPKAVGVAVISASTPDNLYKAFCAINVIQPQNIAVTGVRLNKQVLIIDQGKSEKLAAAVQPENAANKRLIWQSENSGVAAVDQEGKVTGIGQGVTKINVTTAEGGFVATCVVVVNQAAISTGGVTGVRLNHYIMIMKQKSTEKLIAIIEPGNAGNKKVSWKSDKESVAVVGNDGKVTAKSPGVATITATTADGGHAAQCLVVVVDSKNKGKGNKHYDYSNYWNSLKDYYKDHVDDHDED